MDLEKKVLDMQLRDYKLVVAVYMITYNHEDYIEQTVESILEQKTDFVYQLFIGEDCSTDNTRKICLRLKEKYPDKIYLVLNERNLGALQNAKNIFNLCFSSGAKYVAMCEGDDYWVDPLKLQKQVDFLEENEEYVIHSGKAQILKDNKLGKTIGDPLSKKTYNIADFYTKNNLVTCTATFRNILVSYPSFEGLVFGDWKLYTLLLSKKTGNLAYVADEIYAAYRIHDGGAMQKLTSQHEDAEAHLKQIESVSKNLWNKFREEDINTINSYCISIFQHNLKTSNYKRCLSITMRNVFLVKTRLPLRNYLGLINYWKIQKKS